MRYRGDLLHGWTEISSTRGRKLSFSSPLPTTPQEKNPKVPGTLGQALFHTLLLKWSFELSELELSAHTTSPLLFRPLMWNPGFPGKVREAAAAGSGQAISPCYLKYPPCTFNYTLSRPCRPPPSPTPLPRAAAVTETAARACAQNFTRVSRPFVSKHLCFLLAPEELDRRGLKTPAVRSRSQPAR